MFNPETHIIDISTVPKGARAKMMAETPNAAPYWAATASDMLHEKPLVLCAEDAVLFNAESRVNNGIEDGKYPENTFIVVWGSFQPENMVGTSAMPCENKRRLKIPGCRTRLDSLNVEWRPIYMPAEWTVTPPVSPGFQGFAWDSEDDAAMMALDPSLLTLGNPNEKREQPRPFSERRFNQRKMPLLEIRDSPDNTTFTVSPYTWPLYSGTTVFPTQTAPESIDPSWFQAAVTASGSLIGTSSALLVSTPTGLSITTSSVIASITPATTAQPTSICTFQPANPDGGVDHGACACVFGGKTTTLPMLTSVVHTATGPDGAYCGYTAPPTTTVANPATTDVSTYTINCQACTVVGGIADIPTCTSVSSCTPTQAVPTFAVWVADRKLDIGDAEHGDNGTSLAKDMFQQLSSFCSGTTCETNKYAKMKDIETVMDDGEEPLKPQMYWENAVYTDQATLQNMLAAGLATWTQAALKMCTEVEYKADASATGSGCGHGPIPVARRNNMTIMAKPHSIEKRCGDGASCSNPVVCNYRARICSAPDLITVVKSDGHGNPYANEINIGVNYGRNDVFDTFLCDAIVDGLTDAAMILAPELFAAEEGEELTFNALCGEIGSLVNGGS